MIYQVYARYSDTCGNDDFYPYKYVEASSKDEVEKIFPSGFLSGWKVVAITVESLPILVQQTPEEKNLRGW